MGTEFKISWEGIACKHWYLKESGWWKRKRGLEEKWRSCPLLNAGCHIKTWNLNPGIDVKKDADGVWYLLQGRTPYVNDEFWFIVLYSLIAENIYLVYSNLQVENKRLSFNVAFHELTLYTLLFQIM